MLVSDNLATWVRQAGFTIEPDEAAVVITAAHRRVTIRHHEHRGWEVDERPFPNYSRNPPRTIQVNSLVDAERCAIALVGGLARRHAGWDKDLRIPRLPQRDRDFRVNNIAGTAIVRTMAGDTVMLIHGGPRDAPDAPDLLFHLSQPVEKLMQSYQARRGRPLFRTTRPLAPQLATLASVASAGTAVIALLPGGLSFGSLATVFLFTLFTPALLAFAVFVGLLGFMLSDSDPKSTVSLTVALPMAIVGPSLGTLAIFITAIAAAVTIGGTTCYWPIVAAAASALWIFAIFGLAGVLVDRYR